MKSFKMLLLVSAISFSTFMTANPAEKFGDLTSISNEIEKILQESHYKITDDLKVTVFFSISEDKRIQCLSVASGNEDVNYFLKKELENKLLLGDLWRKGVIYELTVDYADVALKYAAL